VGAASVGQGLQPGRTQADAALAQAAAQVIDAELDFVLLRQLRQAIGQ